MQQNMLTAGQILKKRRKELKKTLDEVSQETRIRKEYLQNIEADKYDQFESQVFANGFVKNYAKYLSLNVDKILALYRRTAKEIPSVKVHTKQEPEKKARDYKKYLTPQTVVITLTTTFVLTIIGYILFQFYNFQKPPTLIISEPQNNATTNKNEITIKGLTDTGVLVSINGEQIQTNKEGVFSKKTKLNTGKNTLIVKATKENNKNSQTVTTIAVNYSNDTTDENTDTQQTEDQNTDNTTPAGSKTITVDVENEDAWVELSIDGIQKLAAVLPSDSHETFTGEKEILFTLGKPGVTKISVNGQEVPLPPGAGIGPITCKISKKVECSKS